MSGSSPVPPSPSVSPDPTPTPGLGPTPSPPSSSLSPPPSSHSSPPTPLSPTTPLSLSTVPHSASPSPASSPSTPPPPATTNVTTPESEEPPLTPVKSKPTIHHDGFPSRVSEVPSSQLSDLYARLAPELISPPRLPPHLELALKALPPPSPSSQSQTSEKQPNACALPTIPEYPVSSGRNSPETPTRLSIPILALDPPPDWSQPWDSKKGKREIKWLLAHPGCGPEEVDEDVPLANARMIRAIGRALDINLARLDELESTLNLMHEHISTLEDKITEARVERTGMKRILKELKGQDADQRDSESDKEESVDCPAGGEQMVAKRKAGEVLIATDGECHKAGRFESDSGVSLAVPIQVEPDDAHIPPDEDMKDRGPLDGTCEIKAEPQGKEDIIMAGAAVKTVDQETSESVDGNVDVKEAPQPQPTKQKRAKKAKHNLRNGGGESSKASDAAAALLAERVARVRDRWAYEAGVEHSTFSSMRRDGAAE